LYNNKPALFEQIMQDRAVQ